MKKRITLTALLILMALALAACGGGLAEEPQGPDVVATVNGEPITMAEYQGTLQQQMSMFQQFGMDFDTDEGVELLAELESYVMDELINQKLLLTHARSEGFSADEALVDEQMEAIRSQFPDDEFQQILEENNLTEEILLNDIRNQMITQEFLASMDTGFEPTPVTDGELEQSYAIYEEQTDDPLPFEDVRQELEQDLLAQQEDTHNQQVLMDLLDDLREAADIQFTD